jgi:hypothetical protein
MTLFTEPGGGALVLLIHNDTIRAHIRHEVMHAVSYQTWGWPKDRWVGEGVATWAEGRCQEVSVIAVARELLRREPALTASEFVTTFNARAEFHRHSAYALAASLVDFVRERDGLEGLQKMWRTGEISASAESRSHEDITSSWRTFVERSAVGQPGPKTGAFERFGCG